MTNLQISIIYKPKFKSIQVSGKVDIYQIYYQLKLPQNFKVVIMVVAAAIIDYSPHIWPQIYLEQTYK